MTTQEGNPHMNRDNEKAPRLHDDLQFQATDDGPPRYASTTDNAVEYVAVANTAAGVIGYIWANDTDGAAGWMGRPAAGPDSVNGARPWHQLLRRYKAQDVLPSEAIALLAAHPGGEIGRVVAGSRTRADSLAALREIAAH
ncbi:hypothetical protein ACFVH7_35285 [Kitasatospora indigofera]|uniref:hypothetical protein n=1 Tax=Kitasatospora indigofera TaxID=67307 RepID=UPI003635C334